MINKLSYAYKIGSRLALTKHLPNLSRNQMLALGGAGGGLGALGLGLSAVEGKVLAKSLVDDAVSVAGKSGLADDVVSAAGKSGLGEERGKALKYLTNQLEIAKRKDYQNYGYQPKIMEEMMKSFKGPGLDKLFPKGEYMDLAFLKKQFPGNYQQLEDALWARSRDAYQAASKSTISELEGLRRKLISSGTKPEEVPDILRKAYETRAFATSQQHASRQIRAAAQDLLKTFSQKQ